jgi:hypothetical protein
MYKKMKGPLDVERNRPRLRSGVDRVIKRSLLVRTFMAPIPTAETQLLRSPGGRSVVKGLCGRDPAKDVRAAPCATDTASATAAALGRSFQSPTVADCESDFSKNFRPPHWRVESFKINAFYAAGDGLTCH